MGLFRKREYQVVLEFRGDDPEQFDRVAELEVRLDEALTSGEVDGNDVGRGVVNIFMTTRDPRRCFEEAMRILGAAASAPALGAAGYRDVEKDDYTRLWPKDDPAPFELR